MNRAVEHHARVPHTYSVNAWEITPSWSALCIYKDVKCEDSLTACAWNRHCFC